MSTIICAWLCDIADTWERSQPFPIVMSGRSVSEVLL